MNSSSWLFVLFILLGLTSAVRGSPFFDLFFGNTGGVQSGSYRRSRGRHASGGGYNEYKRICNVVNPNQYAFVGSNPYPGVPFCPP